MSNVISQTAKLTAGQRQQLLAGCDAIAPSWPLDNWIAVNPWWKMHDQPLSSVSAKLAVLSGARGVMPTSYFRGLWQAQRIKQEHIAKAISEHSDDITVDQVLASLESDKVGQEFIPFSRLLDTKRHPKRQISWHDEIIHQISQTVASYAVQMEHQETPNTSLFEYWLEHVIHDRGVEIVMDAPGLRQAFSTLPREPDHLLSITLSEMEISERFCCDFAHAMLLDINGWASWAAHSMWHRKDTDESQNMLWQLLAIRAAWEGVLYRYAHYTESKNYAAVIPRWHNQFVVLPMFYEHAKNAQKELWIWQRAAEIAYQDSLFSALRLEVGTPKQAKTPVMQAIFCIDVRSEVYRRALEAQHNDIETRGFAGFFGLPLSFAPAIGTYQRPQLPGLLQSSMKLKQAQPNKRFSGATRQSWDAFSSSSISMFNAVEASGWLYALKMIKNTWFAGEPKHAVNSTLKPSKWQLVKDDQPISCEDKVLLTHTVLTAMGLTEKFASRVLLVGHGSKTCNNHLQASLDCGACCGQTGEVNVRVLADMLNDLDVRKGLVEKGITIPAKTLFVAALHNTTTDQLETFCDSLTVEQQKWLEQASIIARSERATKLEVSAIKAQKAIFQRSRDWAQLRPEWGLANNASFIIAQRNHTRHCDLQGRSFLHDYDWHQDKDFKTLELILTAPMIVTHWINFQYYASVTDNVKFGSGDKTLHNVVAGHVGVFEGNGGDLRIGLPMQSLHNGQHWMHEPLRLSVLVHAPQEAIQMIVERHLSVKQLVDNQWLYLYAWQPESGDIQRLYKGEWHSA